MKALKLLSLAVVAAFAAAGLSVAPAAPARADVLPDIAFATQELSVPFGGDWLVELQIESTDGYVIDSAWGTVDIQIDDVPGVYSAGLPVMRGGIVYFARPTTAPLLVAGEHRATAVFRSSIAGIAESQTQTPLVITVTPLALAPTLEILEVPGDPAGPYAELTLTGEFVDALGTPAGTWDVSAELDGEPTLDTSVVVESGAGPSTVSLAKLVRPGRTLVVSAVFTADPEVAGGIETTETSSVEVATPALTPLEWLTRSIAVPWWLFAISTALILGTIALVIVLSIRLRRRRRSANEQASDTTVPEHSSIDEPLALDLTDRK